MGNRFFLKKYRHLLSPLILSGFLMLLPGCGGQQAIETDADAQADKPDYETTQEEADGEGAAEALQESIENDIELTSASKAQMEIDQETRDELTAELLEENELDTSVMELGRSTKGCTFDLPEGFEEAEGMEGVYVTDRYPIDASSIYYVAAEQDKSLQLLSQENFKEQTEEGLKAAYDEDITVTIDGFERIKVDGYPGFRILCHYRVGRIQVTQLEYAINADKSYMITYSQTSDYDYMEAYEASAATIRVE